MLIGSNTWTAIRGALTRFRYSEPNTEYRESTFIDYEVDYEQPDGNIHISFVIFFDVCETMELWEVQRYLEFLNSLMSITNILNVCNIVVDNSEVGIDKSELNDVMNRITQILHTGSTREIRQAIKELSL